MLKKRLFISYTVLISLFMIVVLTAVNRAVSGTIDTQMESVTREAVEVGVRDINSLFSDMFSETLNLCVDRQLQAALTDFADGGGEAAGRAVREEGERAISGLRRKLTVEKVGLYPVRDGELYQDEAGYPGGGLPGHEKAGYPGGGLPGREKTVYPGGGSPGREAVRGFLAAPDLAGEEWVRKTRAAGGKFVLTENEGADRTFLRLSKVILSDDRDMRDLALLEVNIDVQILSTRLNQISVQKGLVYLLDDQGRILLPYSHYHQDGNERFGEARSGAFIDRNKHMVIIRPIHTVGWRVAADVPMREILAAGSALRGHVMAISAVAIAAVLLLAIYFSTYISRPVIHISQVMNQVREGDLDIRIDSSRQTGEMKTLYQSFNYMMDMIGDLIQEVYVAKIREKQSELAALQAQINPHFLYNTLDSINWMAIRYGARDIQKMVVSLATMLRYSLNNGQNLIAVQDEIKQVQSYINLQQIRFENCFESEIRIQEEMNSCIIIKLLLQPLVENAIIHGFDEGQYENGHLTITGEIESGHMVFRVMNDGHQADLEVIQRILYPAENVKPKSYGIKNVNDRLRHQYGEEYTLQYRIQGDLTVAVIRIPLEKTGGEAYGGGNDSGGGRR